MPKLWVVALATLIGLISHARLPAQSDTARGVPGLAWPASRLEVHGESAYREGASPSGPAETGNGSAPTAPASGTDTSNHSFSTSPWPTAAPPSSSGPSLPPREQRSGALPAPAAHSGSSSLVTVAGSLGMVVGLFLLVAWFARRAAPRAHMVLPPEVVQVLGRTNLVGRQMLQLVRVGNKLVLLAVHAQGAETITEVTEPAEVDRLMALCERQRPGSITASFRQVLRQFSEEPAEPGFLETTTGHMGPAARGEGADA